MGNNPMKSIRLEHNLNQQEMCKRLAITQGTVSKMEQGISRPSFDVLIRLRQEFNVDLNEFVMNKQWDYFGSLNE